jgi:hypothetical protein
MNTYRKFNNVIEVEREFRTLTRNEQRTLVYDLVDAEEDSDLKPFDFYNLIGFGNLKAYATLLIDLK